MQKYNCTNPESGYLDLPIIRDGRIVTKFGIRVLYTMKYQSKTFILKTLKKSPTCFDLIQIILRELGYSLLLTYLLTYSMEQNP